MKDNFYEYNYPVSYNNHVSNINAERCQSYSYECMTPVLTKNKKDVLLSQSDNSLRLSDRINSVDLQFLNPGSYSRDLTWKQLTKTKQIKKTENQLTSDINSNSQQKVKSQKNIQGFLVIKTDSQQSIAQLPKDLEQLKLLFSKIKNQNKILKDQNFKLRLEKVKQSSNSQSMKMLPLKIQIQNTKNKIANLKQEKIFLQKNKDQKMVQNPLQKYPNYRGQIILPPSLSFEPSINSTTSINKKAQYQTKNGLSLEIDIKNSLNPNNNGKINYNYESNINNRQTLTTFKQSSPQKHVQSRFQGDKKKQANFYYQRSKVSANIYGSGEIQRKMYY